MSGEVRGYRDPVRPIDVEFAHELEVLDQKVRPMPGSIVRRKAVDPRLPHLKTHFTSDGTFGPKMSDVLALYEHLATIRHRRSRVLYVAFRQTLDALLDEQQDLQKYPEWLMKSDVKRTELKIHIAEVLRKPTGMDDRGWLRALDGPLDEKAFEAIVWFLLQKNIISQEMYGHG
jgi:hypothetical protein